MTFKIRTMNLKNKIIKKDKKNGRGKYIHSYRVEIAGPSPHYIFFGQETRLPNQPLQRAEKLTIEVGNIIKKMAH